MLVVVGSQVWRVIGNYVCKWVQLLRHLLLLVWSLLVNLAAHVIVEDDALRVVRERVIALLHGWRCVWLRVHVEEVELEV